MPQAPKAPEAPEVAIGSPPWLIDKAKELLREQRALQDKIAANRRTLRDLDVQDALSEEQGQWLDAFYPLKEKGQRRSEDEIKRTRQVRAEALGVSEDEVTEDEDESENGDDE